MAAVSPLVDVHCHLYYPEFAEDLPEVLEHARNLGVKKICCVSHDAKTARKIIDMAKQSDLVVPLAAAHPVQEDGACVTRDTVEEAVRFVRDHHDHLAGIGECGLDFSPFVVNGPDRDERKARQRWALEEFVKLSREYELPLNVHSRSAGRPTIQLLQQANARWVNMHAFDGSTKVARQALASGYYFSVPPSVVRGPDRQRQIGDLPLGSLLLESDAPALGPVKGERNVPGNVVLSAREIARIKGVTYEQVAAATTENAKRLFPKLFSAPQKSGMPTLVAD
mmetsp:Transcript_14582/g.41432  ORF Transcript_14582/g.41432 Transcript_14582/m.41432 type:complete len:281 (+) Transcript_14582:357-1199(+)